MSKFYFIIITLLFGSITAFAQVEAPSKLPSERLESEFFTDNTDSYSEAQRITLSNNPGDDSPTLQGHINALSKSGGGVITIPEGTWELGEIVLLSDVHLMFDENAIVKPVLSNKTDKSIFIMGFAGASISNISIRSLSGQFTIDMSEISYDLRVLPFNVKDLENFMIAGCHVIDKRTVHSTVNCGVSANNGVWAGARLGLVKDITVENAHDGYGAVQVRVGDRLHFKNIISLSGGATLRIETDAHETSGYNAPREITRISEISGYNIKCNEGNSAVMIQPWGITNGWFDVEKIEATSCMATVRIDRAFVDRDADDIGSFDIDSRITDVTSTYGLKAHIKDGNFKSVPCHMRDMMNDTPVEGTGGRFFEGPTIAPILYTASSVADEDPRYYKVHIPSENELASKSFNFPENSLIVSRWSNTNQNCTSNTDIISVSNLEINPSILKIGIGETDNLIQTISPTTATNQGVSWTSADESIAYVDQWGAVTGINNGKTIITINTTDGNFIATVPIYVGDAILNIEKEVNNSLHIYPNPYNHKDLYIDFNNPMNNVSMSIHNINGERVFYKYYSGLMKSIHISDSKLKLMNGLYIINLRSDNFHISRKLVVCP
ncbi:Ig-like domain-containing protein [Flammeovirga yaeyamensis]|uniref:Ig-like domain-containing protein n=1 Tax=Flammeovirga yaeyamensis TaxID=367791 RepID=A0AAX1NFB1_9BACT|nr:Ig-like domain-containing protein [Flammeovirga yaeyamensis]MBB3696500.1 hypothetical protein [Flammeovirga yaeyamensis]NMF33180.1 T9SS type A sorting domain-containing protein [Flammeovirga yaeyamensis]QWG05540.1 Ig-like domain-containing protein [Flammeovirga yaeyamensis]